MKKSISTICIAMILLLGFSISATEVLKYSVGGIGGLGVGTVARVTGDDAINACGEGQVPVGVIVNYEDDGGSRYYLVASSGIAGNVTVWASAPNPVVAGDKIVPASGGTVQRLSDDTDGFVVGVALENGSAGSTNKVKIGRASCRERV